MQRSSLALRLFALASTALLLRTALAEDVAMTPLTKSAWAALRKAFPELEDHQPQDAEEPMRKLLSWVPAEAQRTLYDQACRPIVRVSRDDVGGLRGSVLQSSERTGDRKVEHWEGVVIDDSIELLCGSTIESERQRNGRWKETASRATGCMTYGPRDLYQVSATAAWYGERRYGLELVVLSNQTRRQTCRDGSERVCSWDVYGFQAAPDPARSSAPIGVSAPERDVDCQQPCPSSNLEAANRAAGILKGQLFRRAVVDPSSQHPALFRTLSACRDYHAKVNLRRARAR